MQIRAADALYCGLADWYLESNKLGTLDEQLDQLEWHETPLKDLQGLLAKLAVQQLPAAPLAALRPAIDHFFALPDVPSMVEQLREVTVADSHEWATATADLLESRSPLAMGVTLEMLRRGRHLSLEQCFALELHLDRQWFERGDLIEGVRALLIDKDKTPRWNPPTLQALDAEHVASFFHRVRAEWELSHARYRIERRASDDPRHGPGFCPRRNRAPCTSLGKRPAGSMTVW